MRSSIRYASLISLFLFNACTQMKEKADLIITNGVIYSADSLNTVAEAMAVKNGKILATGTNKAISDGFRSDETLDLQGKAVFPGFIDAHCHFMGYALGLQYVDLAGSASFEEVLQRLKMAKHPDKHDWLVGRGWDHNLWERKEFPDNIKLNDLFPDTPVMLIRIDGHVVLANDEALKRAGIGIKKQFNDGQVEMKDGRMTGILTESAADCMRNAVPKPAGEELFDLVHEAEKRCFAVGLTGVSDAGLDYDQIMTIDMLQKSGRLKMQVYAMLAPTRQNIDTFLRKGICQTNKLVVRSVKIYADGSLGSRTAQLKQPYSDAPGNSGVLVTNPDTIRALCKLAIEQGYQVNTHCIGDSAVSMMLHIYAGFLKGKNDLRWRIEHAQVVDPEDLHYFRDFSVIPSVQATHATSDMYWAGRRLGKDRIKGAYAYRDLMMQNGWIANGTDFPIENISPLLTFYAAVVRKDLNSFPSVGFQAENALSREDALRSISIWAARADFLENRKGSLEEGKDADFVILDQDIMRIPDRKLPDVRVLKTFVGGEEVFRQ
jgi:predicted amidohydrolase YtcJ